MTQEEANALIMRAYEVHEAGVRGTTDALLSALANVSDVTKTYAFKHRFKSSAAIESKVRRKRFSGLAELTELDKAGKAERDEAWHRRKKQADEDASYSPDHVTDVLGCRFVTLYQSEIPRVVEGLLGAIDKYNQQFPECPVDASEFVIYTNRPPQDPLSIVEDTQRIVRRSALFKDVPAIIREPESRKSAYSSVHFVFAHEVEIQHAGKAMTPERVSFEVQIRDIFEEGWGEVQHDLLYSEKDKFGAEAIDAGIDRSSWTLHLNALKTFVDGCSQHASIIKSNLDGIRAARAPMTTTESVSERPSDLRQVLQLLRRFRASIDAQKQINEGYALLMSADDLVDTGERLRRFQSAASSFDEALASLTARQRDAKVAAGTLTVAYYLEMEKAAAQVAAASLLADGEKKGLLADAEASYTDLERRFPADPTVKMRLGKLIQNRASGVDDLERSERLLDAAIVCIDGDPTTGRDHWIAITARIDKGVAIWKRGRFDSTPESLQEGLAAAAVATQDAFDIWIAQSPSGNELNRVIGHKAASNIIYYLSMFAKNGGTLDALQEKQLREMVEQVERYVGEPYRDWYKTRDNLIHFYQIFEPAKVAELATANFFDLRRKAEDKAGRPLDAAEVCQYLDGSALICFQAAQEALAIDTSAGQAPKGV